MVRHHIIRFIYLFFLYSLINLAISVTAFSASKPDWPDWIEGKSRKYSDEQYLIGVGYGDTRKAAEDAAYTAIGRIFQSEIKSKTNEWESYTQTDIKGKSQSKRDIHIDQIISVATNKVLEDITIAEIWVDETKKQTYALGVMERTHAMSSLSDRITAMDRDISSLQQKAMDSLDKVESIRILRSAMKTLLNREVYNADLRVINPAGKGIDPPISLTDIRQRIQDMFSKEVHIGIQVNGPHQSEIRSSIMEGLTKEGFLVEDTGELSNLDILVSGRVDFEQADLPEYKYVRWAITIDLINQKSGKTFGSLARNGREGHLSFKEAEAKALHGLQKDIVHSLNQVLVSFIFGDDGGDDGGG